MNKLPDNVRDWKKLASNYKNNMDNFLWSITMYITLLDKKEIIELCEKITGKTPKDEHDAISMIRNHPDVQNNDLYYDAVIKGKNKQDSIIDNIKFC